MQKMQIENHKSCIPCEKRWTIYYAYQILKNKAYRKWQALFIVF